MAVLPQKISEIYDNYVATKSKNFKFSQRETECLYFLVRGKTAKGIAQILNLSVRTIESYISNLKIKLGCYSKTELIEKAIENGF